MQIRETMDLVLPYKDKLFRYAFRIVGDIMEAEDVVQEVLIKIWKKKEHFISLDNKEAWCMTLTKNLAIDKTRSKHRRIESIDGHYDLKANDHSPHASTQTLDSLGHIKKMMDQLPTNQKEAIHLRDIEGLTYKEISQITGQSEDQVKVNLHRGRKFLRTQLENLEL